MPAGLRDRITRAIEYGYNEVDHDEQEFIDELPNSLKSEVALIIYNKIVKGIPFFDGKPSQFLSQICPKLKKIMIPKGDIIYRRNDPANQMFFIQKGEVSMILEKFNHFEFLKVKEGYFFGEIELLFNLPKRKDTIIAKTDI